MHKRLDVYGKALNNKQYNIDCIVIRSLYVYYLITIILLFWMPYPELTNRMIKMKISKVSSSNTVSNSNT